MNAYYAPDPLQTLEIEGYLRHVLCSGGVQILSNSLNWIKTFSCSMQGKYGATPFCVEFKIKLKCIIRVRKSNRVLPFPPTILTALMPLSGWGRGYLCCAGVLSLCRLLYHQCPSLGEPLAVSSHLCLYLLESWDQPGLQEVLAPLSGEWVLGVRRPSSPLLTLSQLWPLSVLGISQLNCCFWTAFPDIPPPTAEAGGASGLPALKALHVSTHSQGPHPAL